MQRQIFALVPLLALSLAIAPASAQIIPSAATTPGATGTIVTPGSEINITGGQTAGTNLFHSFSQFGLTQGQVANFQTAAEIKNVLARVNGGNPSVIDGLLKLTGSSSSLYLMNPAGIIFGNNAKINIPGSFVATTATNIGIGNGSFNAIGPNSYVSGTPSSFVFQPGARGAIINTAFDLPDWGFMGQGYNRPSTGERRTLALIGNTVLNLESIQTDKDNIALFAVPENSSLTYIGSQTSIGPVDFNTIVKPNPGQTIMNLPAFNAFNIPTLSGLTTLSSQSDQYHSDRIKTMGNGQVVLADTNNTVINPGDLYSRTVNIPTSAVPSEIGSIALLSDQKVISGGAIRAANNVRVDGRTVQSVYPGDKAYASAIYSSFWTISGETVEIFARGNVDIPTPVSARSLLRIHTDGDVRVGGLSAVLPNGTARNSAGGNIDVRANSLQVTNAQFSPGGIQGERVMVDTPSGSWIEDPSRFSILASGAISIEQTGSGRFIEAAGLERDANGSVVYRLASNPDTRVTIVGVKVPASETLVPYTDPIARTWLKDTVTGELTPYDGNNLVLKNVATGELIQDGRVIIRPSNNPASLNGGGTLGLIGRLDKSSGFLTELSGNTKPVNTQNPAMISITSKTGSTSLANPIGGSLPGSYSNVPSLAKPSLSVPQQPQGNLPPTTPDPVLYSPTITPTPQPIAQSKVVVQPSAQSAPPAPTQSEVVLYHRPVLSSSATRATLDTGILKIEIDPLEQGVLTLYRQPVTQTTAPEEKPKT